MTLVKYRELINARISTWLAQEIQNSPEEHTKLLLSRLESLIMRGGKRARPQLFFLTYLGYGGSKFIELIDIGAALEFHHQFLLIHDDIMDNDLIRYDGPNIAGYYQKDNFTIDDAQTMALLAGDILFSYSWQLVTESLLSSEDKIKVLNLLSVTNTKVQQGQLLDVLNTKESISSFSKAKLLQIHDLKTASYTTLLPMLIAARLLRLDQKEIKKIEMFARDFGLYFQLVDDYSDYFENKSAFNNRPKYRDFRQGKTTYPLMATIENCKSRDKAIIIDFLGNKLLDEKNMKLVVSIMQRSGGQKIARDEIESSYDSLILLCNKLSLSEPAKQTLKSIIESYRV